jgi:uncharacterized membrane protein
MTMAVDVMPTPTGSRDGPPAPARPRERRHELDALRVLAVLALLLYHASRPFDAEVWHIKDVGRGGWARGRRG